jgi:hypothetical protein
LTTRHTYALAVAQGCRLQGPVEERPARSVVGVADPVDLVALAV